MVQTNDTAPALAAAQDTSTRQLIRGKLLRWLREEASLPIDWIDDDEPLARLGIDSLGVATVACELEQVTQKKMNLEVLYELESISDLAAYLDALPPLSRLPAASFAPNPATVIATSVAMPMPPAAKPADPLDYYKRLNRRVRSVQDQGLYFFEPQISRHDGAWVHVDGKRMLMLGSYEYLGLLGHPRLKQATLAALDEFGTGHHGARLLAGTTTLHKQLEAKLAEFMQAEDAVVFSSGYVTNLATIATLVDQSCCVIGDQWNHASIVDGCRLSGAELLVFSHNDIDSLAEKLEQTGGRRTLVVVDAVFSMDGDIVDLPAVVDLCKKHGALLMVDEAHSLGVLGETGRGIQQHFGLAADDIDVKMGTLSKTLAGCGGFVAGREEITTYLRHHARGYIFSGALPATQVGTALAALEVIDQQPDLIRRLWDNVDHYVRGLRDLGFDTGNSETPIVPVMTRDDATTLEMTRICRAEGLLVIPVCFPAVPMNAPRLRTCISAVHEPGEIEFALDVLARAGRQTNLIPAAV